MDKHIFVIWVFSCILDKPVTYILWGGVGLASLHPMGWQGNPGFLGSRHLSCESGLYLLVGVHNVHYCLGRTEGKFCSPRPTHYSHRCFCNQMCAFFSPH